MFTLPFKVQPTPEAWIGSIFFKQGQGRRQRHWQ
jgi:hypothetical protein